jgi:hypothetical protein
LALRRVFIVIVDFVVFVGVVGVVGFLKISLPTKHKIAAKGDFVLSYLS